MTSTAFEAYLTLTKPKVVLLMLLTAWVGMILAEPGVMSWSNTFLGLLGIGLAASSGAAINHLIDRHVDRLMLRTQKRPLPKGQVTNRAVIAFATLLGTAGFFILFIGVNATCAILTLCSLVGYACVYTGFLKRKTPQNIVIGGFAGALPPLLGWSAVTNDVSASAWILVMIIYTWTPPHFWALAIHRYEDYARAKIPMMPVTHGIRFTKLNILLYTALMCVATIMPFVIGMSHLLYLCGVLLLNARFLQWAFRLMRADDASTPEVSMALFRYSITYLMVLFILMCTDHYWVIDAFWEPVL